MRPLSPSRCLLCGSPGLTDSDPLPRAPLPSSPSSPPQTFNYNALETLLLVTAMFILLAGMTFQSGVTSPGSGGHTSLTALVAFVLVGCVTLFVSKNRATISKGNITRGAT